MNLSQRNYTKPWWEEGKRISEYRILVEMKQLNQTDGRTEGESQEKAKLESDRRRR